MRCASPLALILALAGATAAQVTCVDPVAPPQGFNVTLTADVLITYADGYVTKADFRRPSVAPGPCGWPLVLLIHGGGQNKDTMAVHGQYFAARGYASIVFDLRGAGSSYALNDPAIYFQSLIEFRDRFDIFEVMEFAEATWPTEVDFDRIGVAGNSAGGRNSWYAAAYSEQLPPPNPWRTARFPKITCVVPDHHTADMDDLWVPEGRAVHLLFFGLIANAAGILSPTEVAQLQTPLLNEDFPGLLAAMNPPGLSLPPLLATSRVPYSSTLSYDDWIISARGGISGTWGATPAGVPKRVNYSTGSHGSPRNDKETLFRLTLRRRWMDRWLKGTLNGVDTEPPVRAPTTPDDVVDYTDLAYIWDERESPVLLPSTPKVRWYLEGGSTLSTTAPTAVTGSDLITHQSSIDVQTFAQVLPSAQVLMSTYIPLSSVPYDTPVLSEDSHLLGPADVRVFTRSGQSRFQVHAALYDVDPLGNERFVCDGFTTVRDNLPVGTNLLSFRTYVQSYVFRAGHRIRLRVENLVLHQPPTGLQPQIRVVPVFDSSQVEVLREVGALSYIDLPIAGLTQPTNVASELEYRDIAPADVSFGVHSSSASRGHLYVTLLSLSGSSPGITSGGVHLALNPDALTTAALSSPTTPPFSNLVGTLDPTGHGQAQLLLAGLGPLALAGNTLTTVTVDFDPLTGQATPSDPVELPMLP